MSGRTAAAALCLAAFFATAPAARWQWITSAWNALTAAVEQPSAPPPESDPLPGRGDEGWLIDPNG
jgi:hypothetical protein